jgi:hypothetical protein
MAVIFKGGDYCALRREQNAGVAKTCFRREQDTEIWAWEEKRNPDLNIN